MIERPAQSGFSLVELSIVLVILGLLTGGILAGQALIRAAELRSVSTEYARYVTAAQSFRDKYFATPGDMNNATQFWGRLNNNAWCVTNSSAAVNAAAGACDGNGDGIVGNAAAASQSGEIFQAWRQLALAGLIEGSYTGIAGSGSVTHSIIGTNVPRSRMSNGGWSTFNPSSSLSYSDPFPGSWFAGNYGNTFHVGVAVTNGITEAPIFKPEEAWNIDTKMDDGKPGAGRIITAEPNGFAASIANKCSTATSSTDFASNYNLSNTPIICSLRFTQAL